MGLKAVLDELFPLVRMPAPNEYVDQNLADAGQRANIAALRGAATAATDVDCLKELRDVAISKKADEDSRQGSIIGRAQGLFVALALFGVLFTFGTNLLTATSSFSKLWIGACALFVIYMLAQMFIMLANILKAIGGISYPTAGSSDLANWISLPTSADFYRAQALLTLDHYRRAALNNTWRSVHFEHALKGLRNVFLALGLLILTLFGLALSLPPHKSDPLLMIFS